MIPKSRPPFQSTPEKRHTVASVDEIKSNFSINSDNVFVTPTKESSVTMDDGSIMTEHGSVRGHRGDVKTKCSELTFSPSEGEMEHVLEEKSISMINLPAFRANMDNSFTTEECLTDENITDDVKVSKSEIVFTINSNVNNHDETDSRKYSVNGVDDSGMEIDNEQKLSINSNLDKSVNDSGLEPDSSSVDHQEILAKQHKQLQEQFTMWQDQLEQNKKLLASTQAIPADDTSRQLQQQLQSQMQMQQQMIQQIATKVWEAPIRTNNSNKKVWRASRDIYKVRKNHISEVVEKTEVQTTNIPPPPALPNGKLTSNGVTSGEQPKTKSKTKSKKYIEPKLDPREELMIAIKKLWWKECNEKR